MSLLPLPAPSVLWEGAPGLCYLTLKHWSLSQGSTQAAEILLTHLGPLGREQPAK